MGVIISIAILALALASGMLQGITGYQIHTQTTITGCTEISSPGEYVLANDIIDSSSSTCINITSSNVVFDAAGHLIDGDNFNSAYAIYLNYGNLENITVKNARITDWGAYSVYVYASSNVFISNMSSTQKIHIENSNHISIDKVYFDNGGHTMEHAMYIGPYCSYINVTNSTFFNIYSSNDAVTFYYTDYVNFINNTVHSNNFGVGLSSSNNNIIAHNFIYDNIYGLSFSSVSNTLVYDNFFNNTNNAFSSGNYLNTTLQNGTSIIGGNLIGGNFWAKPDGTGFSERCVDADVNGICDYPYQAAPGAVDYLPLTLPANTTISGCTIIRQPGYYSLANDINSGSSCILINVSNVVLDGNGKLINGTGASGTYGVYTNESVPLSNITIKNLKVSNYDKGIFFGRVENGTIENSVMTANTIGIEISQSNYNKNILVRNNSALGNSNTGIYFGYVDNGTIENNTADSNGYGISLDYNCFNITVRNNFISSNSIIGFDLSTEYVEVYNNFFNNSENVGGYIPGLEPPVILNTTPKYGQRIYGTGILGGNFWASPSGDGFSETCNDTDANGFCDEELITGGADGGKLLIDYLPLSLNCTFSKLYDFAVTGVSIQPESPSTISDVSAKITYSAYSRYEGMPSYSGLSMQVFLDDKPLLSKAFDPAFGSNVYEFKLGTLTSGQHTLKVVLNTNDENNANNIFEEKFSVSQFIVRNQTPPSPPPEQPQQPPQQQCPTCPECGPWSDCLGGEQIRTCFVCSAATNYTCVESIERRSCNVTQPSGNETPITNTIAVVQSAANMISAQPQLSPFMPAGSVVLQPAMELLKIISAIIERPVTCGNGTCDANENVYNCSLDCHSPEDLSPVVSALVLLVIVSGWALKQRALRRARARAVLRKLRKEQ